MLLICLEAEHALATRRAAMRSCGVGDGDVFAEPERIKEKEIQTVYIEPDKPEQRNVGLQVHCIVQAFYARIHICSHLQITSSQLSG